MPITASLPPIAMAMTRPTTSSAPARIKRSIRYASMRRTGPATRYRNRTCSGVSTSAVLSSGTRFSPNRIEGAAARRQGFLLSPLPPGEGTRALLLLGGLLGFGGGLFVFFGRGGRGLVVGVRVGC